MTGGPGDEAQLPHAVEEWLDRLIYYPKRRHARAYAEYLLGSAERPARPLADWADKAEQKVLRLLAQDRPDVHPPQRIGRHGFETPIRLAWEDKVSDGVPPESPGGPHPDKREPSDAPQGADEVARRVTSLWGQSRAGARIRNAVTSALRTAVSSHGLATDKGFYWREGFVVAEPRDRSDSSLPSTLSKAKYLPPAEIRRAIEGILAKNIGASAEDIVRETTRVFGFKRAGVDLKEVVEAELRRMLVDEVVQFKGERVYLASQRRG